MRSLLYTSLSQAHGAHLVDWTASDIGSAVLDKLTIMSYRRIDAPKYICTAVRRPPLSTLGRIERAHKKSHFKCVFGHQALHATTSEWSKMYLSQNPDR